MIRIASPPPSTNNTEPWHAGFLEMLPKIQRRASLAFRGLPAETREDLIEEVVAHAVVAFKALYTRARSTLRIPRCSPCTGFAESRSGARLGRS